MFNLSEQSYPATTLDCAVHAYVFNGYPHPSLVDLLQIVLHVLSFVSENNTHQAVLHCQSSRGRSAMVLCCLLSFLQVVNHPYEALDLLARQLRT